MQDRYAGDVGDFGKFGLLRHLCGVTAQDKHARFKKPGVIWYKTNPGNGEQDKPDGNITTYLQTEVNKPRLYMECDEVVFKALKDVVAKRRTIAALQDAQLLPDAVYWPNDVRHGPSRVTCPRADWFQDALKATAGCDLVFLDPDNGIECANVRPTQGKSRKYVFRCEVGELIERGQSVVIYHHTCFNVPTEEQARQHVRMLAKKITLPDRPFGVLFHRGPTRAFLILPVQKHYQALLDRTKALVQKWGEDEWKTGKPRLIFYTMPAEVVHFQ